MCKRATSTRVPSGVMSPGAAGCRLPRVPLDPGRRMPTQPLTHTPTLFGCFFGWGWQRSVCCCGFTAAGNGRLGTQVRMQCSSCEAAPLPRAAAAHSRRCPQPAWRSCTPLPAASLLRVLPCACKQGGQIPAGGPAGRSSGRAAGRGRSGWPLPWATPALTPDAHTCFVLALPCLQ